jgi:hypothetical protein
MRAGRAWLCVGPVLLCLLDAGLTLQGQSAAYWAGSYDQARELNPLGRWPLQTHPVLFAAAVLCWVAVFCTAIFRLRARTARLLSPAVQFGHTVGAASWLARAGALGWLVAVLLLSGSGLLLEGAWLSSRRPGTEVPRGP